MKLGSTFVDFSHVQNYDFVVIGGGAAGLTAANEVVNANRRVAIIDSGPVGGLCSLNGCNPKKVLVRSTELLDEFRRAGIFGFDKIDPKIDWPRVIDRKNSFTKPVTTETEAWLKEAGIELIRGAPKFNSPDELVVGDRRIHAQGFLISTGSMPRPLKFDGAHWTKTSDDILATSKVPKRLCIIGAGVAAFEFGQVFARLGSRVTMLTPDPRPLMDEDRNLVAALTEFSKSLGIEILVKTEPRSLRQQNGDFVLTCKSEEQIQEIHCDYVLNAAGRVPSIGTLALDRAHVETYPRGIVVNEYLRSFSNPKVFAAGDAHGRFQLSPIAANERWIAATNFLHGDVERAVYEAIPRAVFTIPPLASVGMTEDEARRHGLQISVIDQDIHDWKVYAIAGENLARMKIILDSSSRKILGTHWLGRNAEEVINLFALAIRFEVTADQLGSLVFTYPSMGSTISSLFG